MFALDAVVAHVIFPPMLLLATGVPEFSTMVRICDPISYEFPSYPLICIFPSKSPECTGNNEDAVLRLLFKMKVTRSVSSSMDLVISVSPLIVLYSKLEFSTTNTPPMYKSSVTPMPPLVTNAPEVLDVDCVVLIAPNTPPTYIC